MIHAAMIYGAGTKSCGSWTRERSTEVMSPLRVNMEAWILGFLTGAGWMEQLELGEGDAEGKFAWIDNYCKAKPLDSIDSAAAGLVAVLALKK